ncbi:uncharacterized protein C3orf38 homolog isoform X1 [Lytechinus variegatus]|uniref:uncharacterized protein C3orf38 homolog isoform X1 n=1 Tax=Lytechinus variegatus TaxID=7654 RepID=UPI001BB12E28|nr:uncharacterized protein C3orf38 homolog isoform X1 [Lytechinus variegatus]
MLSEREKNGVRKLLGKIPEEDIVQLANTVTNRLVVVQNRREATKAIAMYSDSAEQLLRRKLVKRDVIFSYLADLHVPVSPGADKHKLIQKVLMCWQTSDDLSGIKDEYETDESPISSQELSDSSQDTFRLSQESTSRDSSSHSTPADTSWCQDLAVQFSSWFFTQLNQLHPQQTKESNNEWGPSHFLDDANLKLYVLRGTDRRLDAYDGSALVSQRLGCLVKDEGLVFNPNLTAEGTRGCSEPHGLVMIAVCGTIHKAGMCIGLFEQNIGLVRDPAADNNWKIKFINMQIKDGSSRNVPTLGNFSELNAISM